MLVALLALDAAVKKSVRNFYRCGLTKVRVVNTTNSCSTTAASILLRKDSLKGKVIVNPVYTMDSGCNIERPIATNTTMTENALENGGSTENANESNGAAIITFEPGLKECCQEITSSHVKVLTSPGNHDHGSSRVKLKNIVDYKWEIKNYPAHLIAVHLNERYVAYVINVNKVTRMEGMVRVVNTESSLRALIKGMSGDILDLQFAHIEKEYILACIDMNCLYVHQIDERDDTMVCNLIIKIESPLNNHTPKHDMISWCPFIEIPGEDDEDNQLIVWARGNIFQCFNINTIVAEHGIGKIMDNQIQIGFIKHEDESIIITWVALSPDGSTLGVGSTDGTIRFYQVYLHDKDPRCLHEWKPHNGKPISSFFFLDNLTKTNTDIYWKFVITAACNNAEFKVWDCGTWNCLQTITMLSASDGGDKNLHFLAEIDRTSSYLVVSSIDTRACYVMQIINLSACSGSIKDCTSDNGEYSMALQRDTSSSSALSNSPTSTPITIKSSNSSFPPNVYIKSVAEFPLNSGILSFSIIDAAVRRYKCSNDDYLCEEMDDYDEETNSICCVVIRMYIVQSKSVQKCHILYQPTVHESADFKSTISSSHSNDHISVHSKILSPHIDCLSISFNQESDNGSLIANNDIHDDDDDDDDEENENNINNVVVVEQNATNNTGKNPFELLLGIKAENNLLNGIQENSTTPSTDSTVMSVPLPTAEETDKSPHAATAANLSTTSFSQLNLMTPDAFSSPAATSSTLTEQKTPENVSTDVLNTILMLASVTGSSSKPDNLTVLNLSSNDIENHEQQQQQQQQQQQHQTQQQQQQTQQQQTQQQQTTPLKHDVENQKRFIAIDRNPGRNINDILTSGGSSPSREVQEIMSLQDYKGSFSGDEQLLEEHSVKSLVKVEDTKTQTTTMGQESITKSNTKILWTEGSNTKHSTELLNAANLISQAVNATSISSLNNGHSQQPNLSTAANANAPATRSSPELSEMNLKISELIDLVKMQSIQINTLQNGFNEMINANILATINNNITELSYKLEIQLCKLMEQYLKRYETELKRRLAGLTSEGDAKNQTLTETIVQVMNQCVLTQLGDVMNHEIQRQVAPMLSKKMDAFHHQIQVDVANKLSHYDEILKENLTDACKSKNILEAFGNSVLMGVQSSLQAAFIESMSSTLIPAYEKSSQNMFQQLHEAFSVGIKDFIDQYNNYLQQLQPMQCSTDDILNKFSGLHNNLESILTMHRASVQDFLAETRKDIKTLEVTLGHQLQGVIRSEVLCVRKSFESQAPVLRSQASTPAPIQSVKDTIKVLLMQGQMNKAFHQALLANDLSLVEFTLKSADRYTVFTPTCCLEQKVLLSLIQQISADMHNHNEVKHSYLCESLLAIKHDDPIIIQHAPKVINELYRNCQLFLVSYPKSQQCSNVRILMKAVQNILDKFQYMSNC